MHSLHTTSNRNEKPFLFRKAILLFLLCLSLSARERLNAATYTVTSATDHPVSGGVNPITGVITGGVGNGLVTIRSAIIAANANAGADVILFSAALNGIPHTLTIAGANENNCATGDLDIKGALTITGNGPTNTIIQAGTSATNGIDKVFSVNPLFNAAFATTISGLTMRYGRNPSTFTGDGFGGGMDWEGSATGTLVINNCVITDNSTLDGDGGGLTLTNTPSGTGNVTITNSTISNNKTARIAPTASPFGGGVFVGTALQITMTNCSISGNSVNGSGGNGLGGGILLYNPNPTSGQSALTNCVISNNSAPSDGGGIFTNQALTITSCTFSGNSSGHYGGAMYMNFSNSTVTISKTTFLNNSASSRGGAIYHGPSTTANVLNVSYSRFSGNTAPSPSAVSVENGTATLQNNWWGCNEGPSNAACNQAGVVSGGTGTVNFTPWLTLRNSASPSSICTGASATLTAGFLTNSSGGAVAASNLDVLIGLPISFTNAVLGNLSNAQTSIQPNGTATATFTAGNTSGTGSANAVVDNVPNNDALAKASVTINPGPTVTNPTTTSATAGTSFSQTFTQSGGTTPVSFTLNSGTLPTGLTLATNGTLSGTPTQTGSFPITVKVTATGGCGGVGPTYNLVISCQTITVTNPSTTSGTAGTSFSQTFTQTGAISGANFTLNSGTLPTDLSLSTTGVLSGTPTQTGSFPITVKVTDGNGCTGTSPVYSLSVSNNTPTITGFSVSPNPVCAGSPVTFTATVGNVSGSYSYTLTNGSGPITGSTASTAFSQSLTASGSGVQTYTLTVSSNGQTATATTSLTVNALPVATVTLSNGGTLTCAQTSLTISVSGGSYYNFARQGGGGITSVSGAVPDGMLHDGFAVVNLSGVYSITTTVASTGCSSVTTTTVTSNTATITVSNSATSTATQGTAFSQSFTASGGVSPYSFSIASGSLPIGLNLSTTGTVSGTPTQSGSFSMTVRATDANGCTATATATLTVLAPQPDLTPVIYVRPSTPSNASPVTVVVEVFELNSAPTSGTITLRISRDPLYPLSFDPMATTIGGRSVMNGSWSFDDTNANYYQLTTSSVIGAGSVLGVGLSGTIQSGQSTGTATVTVVILTQTGSEQRSDNNMDADRIDYF